MRRQFMYLLLLTTLAQQQLHQRTLHKHVADKSWAQAGCTQRSLETIGPHINHNVGFLTVLVFVFSMTSLTNKKTLMMNFPTDLFKQVFNCNLLLDAPLFLCLLIQPSVDAGRPDLDRVQHDAMQHLDLVGLQRRHMRPSSVIAADIPGAPMTSGGGRPLPGSHAQRDHFWSPTTTTFMPRGPIGLDVLRATMQEAMDASHALYATADQVSQLACITTNHAIRAANAYTRAFMYMDAFIEAQGRSNA